MPKLKIQFDYYGNFRLVSEDGQHKGRWTLYQHAATLEIDGVTFIAFSQYYEGTLPVETIFRLEVVRQDCLEEVKGTRPE